jgi:hypothetical protein
MHLGCDLSPQAPHPNVKRSSIRIQHRAQVRRHTKRFNRDTVWLATGVLGTVAFAALVLAFQERQPQVRQAESDFLPNVPASVASEVANSSKANGNMTPISSSQTETAANSVLADTPQINRNAHRSARARGSKTPNGGNRSSVVFGSAYVKRRLIELWHEWREDKAHLG